MMVTTVTTAASFLSNLQSEFPLIAAFGTFAALLVLFNYAMVVTYFPSVVMFYHTVYVKDKEDASQQWNEHLKSKSKKDRGVSLAPELGEVYEDDKKTQAVFSDSKCGSLIGKCSRARQQWKEFNMSDFMANTYSPWLFKYRYHVLAFTTCFMIAFFVLASMVVSVPFFFYTLFPAGTNFHDWAYVFQTQMSSLSSPLYAYITFGFDVHQPLEYNNDFKAYKFVWGADGSGTPVYDTQFEISEPLTQLQMLETCALVNDDVLDNRGLKIDDNYGINPQLSGGDVDAR